MKYLKNFESFNYSISPKIWKGINDVIYTCIIGNHDNLLEQPKIKGVDYVCFTDQDLKGEGWNIIKIDSLPIDDRLYAKHPKMLPSLWLPKVKRSIWIDGSIEISDDDIFNKFSDYCMNGMSLFKHPERDCIYDEIDVSYELPKYKNQNLLAQGKKYKKLGWPKNAGLWACGVIYREHGLKNIENLGKDWYRSQEDESIQDQIPFPYLLDRNKISPGVIPGSIWNNPHFKVVGHKRDS
jgi:hypothetical protein